ncbi:MAG: SurA N-terminal domain-containing protein [Planctomycetes bacterium]|nr:SurA N-terminal domain-containing protein [Planctomycetota bacterium]
MTVTKFFRRYTKILLMVFMSLLLVVFLIGDVLQQMGSKWRNPEQEIGEAFGQPISTTDLRRANSDMQILAQLRMLPSGLNQLDVYLLQQEARRMGVRVGHAEVKATLGSLPNSGVMLAAIRDRYGRSLDSIYDVVGEWLAIRRAAGYQVAVLGESRPRVELAYRDQMQEAVVKLAVLESKAFLASVPEATPAEVAEYFEQAKNRTGSNAEDLLEFGYQQPDRVQIEYLTVDPKAIQIKVRVRELEAERFYEDHREQYYEKVPRPPSTTQPTEEPQFDHVPRSYEEVRDKVREDCRAVKAIEEAQRLMNDIYREARRPWDAASLDDDGFHVMPPAETLVSLEALRDRFSEQYEVAYRKTELVDQRGLQSERGFGRASYLVGNERISARDMALRVKGLMVPEENDQLPALNLYEPSPVLLDQQSDPLTGNPRPYQAYIFRVIQVVPSGPPDTLDEVRAEVTEDLKQLRAHELAGTHAERLAERARAVGLDAAVEEATELKALLTQAEEAATSQPSGPRLPRPRWLESLGPFTPSRAFSRRSLYLQNVGVSRNLPEAVFVLADEPAQAGKHRVALVQVANVRKWVVAELEEVKPIYAGQFAQLREQVAVRSAQMESSHFAQAWFATENIRQRAGYKPRVAEP